MRRMGHNKMFAAYSEYSIGFRPEAALIQHNSRCGGVAVSGSVGGDPLPADSEARPGQKPSPPNYERRQRLHSSLSACLRNGMARAAGRLCPTKRDARGKGFQIWLNVTAFDACIHARLVRHSPGGKERGAEVILLI